MDIDIDANSVVTEVEAQRNQAMTEVAVLRAALNQAQKELAELKNDTT